MNLPAVLSIVTFSFSLMVCLPSYSQQKKVTENKPLFNEELMSGLTFRNIGPAFMSGRISDIAIHPYNPSTWLISAGSGGVWLTENAGTTWTPIFDQYPSFSIGCVAFDPQHPTTIWVGTGENVGGRHVGIGDGLYKSVDGGKTFLHMGLKDSEHISKIIIHPANSQIIWVAAQGPLWSKGGERGIFMSSDGGVTWQKTLGDQEWTGATDLIIDPRNSDILYAATWQRHRTVAAYIGGGKGSGIHKSIDGGKTWQKLTNGLPTGVVGKTGIAISPQNSNVIYAAMELERRSGAVFRSEDGGASWSKMSETVAGGTGPHYYQELYASPHYFDRIYLMDVRMQCSMDGGKTFQAMKEEFKHSDNHALAFLPDRKNYLLAGCDGGLYQSHNHGEHWQFFGNLPLTQFYDIAIDDTKPFYKIYGGTQDNSTQCGPSRTLHMQGITNSDWSIVLDWDGHQPATEPGNPDIVYGQRQEGTLARIDMRTGEVTDIKPVPREGESYERFNWDAPILVSPHHPKHLFFASQRLWKSEDRGDSWRPLSGDLTKNQDRLQLPVMGQSQGYDNAWDLLAMSNFNTITMVAESPIKEGLIYVGTDDGLLQITENNGLTWRKIDVSALPGCPANAYVNDIKADLFDINTAYVVLDNHKSGDFQPYVYKTTDQGKTWTSLKGDLPARHFVWRIVQDPVRSQLLFVGTEFGIFVSINGGKNWVKMKGGLPTISVRDIKIHSRDHDLVIATFGRGIYVLDDISALRKLSEEWLSSNEGLIAARDAWWYIPRPYLGFEGPKGDQGASYFQTPNPDFGAIFTYVIKEEFKSKKQIRQEKEKEAEKNRIPISFPEWSEIEEEELEISDKVIIQISDGNNQIVRKLEQPASKGLHRVTWDLRLPVNDPITENGPSGMTGFLVMPGTYKVNLFLENDGLITPLGDSVFFKVNVLYHQLERSIPLNEVKSFWETFEKAASKANEYQLVIQQAKKFSKSLRSAYFNTSIDRPEYLKTLNEANIQIETIQKQLGGSQPKAKIGEKDVPNIYSRLFDIARGVTGATFGPTKTNLQSMELVRSSLNTVQSSLELVKNKLNILHEDIQKSGGPYVEKYW